MNPGNSQESVKNSTEGSVAPRWEGMLLLALSVFSKAEEQFPAGSQCPNSQETPDLAYFLACCT